VCLRLGGWWGSVGVAEIIVGGEEERLGEGQTLLHDFTLQTQVLDAWQLDPARGYSVSSAYQLLTSQQTVTLDAAEDLIWHKHAH
jgi:hypothetical protein